MFNVIESFIGIGKKVYKIIYKNDKPLFVHEIQELIEDKDNYEYFLNTYHMERKYAYVCIFYNKKDAQDAVEYLMSYVVMNKLLE